MFLQEILLEYEMTIPDWRSSPSNEQLMLTIRAMLASSEAAGTVPVFTSAEIMFLQEILLEFRQRSPDWENRLSDFNLMLYAEQEAGTDFGAITPGSELMEARDRTNSHTIHTPPVADPTLQKAVADAEVSPDVHVN